MIPRLPELHAPALRLLIVAALTCWTAALHADQAARPGLAYQLTHSATIDPSLSPDGHRMVYITVVAGREQLFTADADSSNPIQITHEAFVHEDPAWSPDGTQIAFASNRRANYQIYVMKPDGTAVRLVANTEGRATAPTWSKDSKSLYFPVCRKVDYGGDCEIFVAPAPSPAAAP